MITMWVQPYCVHCLLVMLLVKRCHLQITFMHALDKHSSMWWFEIWSIMSSHDRKLCCRSVQGLSLYCPSAADCYSLSTGFCYIVSNHYHSDMLIGLRASQQHQFSRHISVSNIDRVHSMHGWDEICVHNFRDIVGGLCVGERIILKLIDQPSYFQLLKNDCML
jgi:hypothetical protein